MLRAMTSTCSRDLDLVVRLNKQLRRLGVDHFLFVEEAERPGFERFDFPPGRLLVKPDGGDNGLGRAGSITRWHCHQQLLPIVAENDTFFNVDSDIYFQDETVIPYLVCEPGEIKGFDGGSFVYEGREFRHISGMVFASHGGVFQRAMSVSGEALDGACWGINATGVSPSEDVMVSWLYQTRGELTKITDIGKRYPRGGDAHFPVRHSREMT